MNDHGGIIRLFLITLLVLAAPGCADGPPTTSVTISKLATDNSILEEVTVNYTWMEANLPVYGDGVTHYYHQGPTFDPDNLWDSGELDNTSINSRDYGAAMGTDVKDLCDLVSGMNAGEWVEIKASDGFTKRFDYDDIYLPEPELGRMVIVWYNPTFGGYPPAYSTGMRLIFFANTTNPYGKYVFGNWDMHNTLASNRWHYYYDSITGILFPSSSGLSVAEVDRIIIHSDDPAPVSAAFTVNSTSGTAPLTVQFTDQSAGSPTEWAWDFEDNGSVDSTVQNPVHIYSSPGTYSVNLTVTNAGGSDTLVKSDYITVLAPVTIDVEATGEITGWDLQPSGENVNSTAIDLTVTTTAPSWDVRVSDVSENPHPGHMAQWIEGSGYVSGGYFLAEEMGVKVKESDLYAGANSGSIILDQNDGTGIYDVWLRQTTVPGDTALGSGLYRVEITFTGSVN